MSDHCQVCGSHAFSERYLDGEWGVWCYENHYMHPLKNFDLRIADYLIGLPKNVTDLSLSDADVINGQVNEMRQVS